MNTSQSTQKGKRDKLISFKYFAQVFTTGAQIFAKHQFQLSNLNFTTKSALFHRAILNFFSRHSLNFHPKKIGPERDRLQSFLHICSNFGKIFGTNASQFFFFLYNVWVIPYTKSAADVTW